MPRPLILLDKQIAYLRVKVGGGACPARTIKFNGGRGMPRPYNQIQWRARHTSPVHERGECSRRRDVNHDFLRRRVMKIRSILAAGALMAAVCGVASADVTGTIKFEG